jgi:UBA/THIF-type NAD/FAD binding fold protein
MRRDMIRNYSSKEIYEDDGVIYVNGIAIGAVSPTVLFGKKNGGLFINSKKGIYGFDGSPKGFWDAMIKSGAILFGGQDDSRDFTMLLRSSRHSRTVSYLSSVFDSCSEIVGAVRKIAESKILVVGGGGIGSMVAVNMAGCGVRNIVVVDGDVVEESNLNRQFLFSRADIGKHKATVIKRFIENRYEDVLVIDICEFFGENVCEGSYDAIVVSADNPLGVVDRISNHFSADVIYAGYVHDESVAGFVGDCSEQGDSIKWERSESFIGPSIGPVNMELAGVAAGICLNHILGADVSRKIFSWKNWKFPHDYR